MVPVPHGGDGQPRYIAAACLANGDTIRLIAKPKRVANSKDNSHAMGLATPVTRRQGDSYAGPFARSLQMLLHAPSPHARLSYEPLAGEMERASTEIRVTADGRGVGEGVSGQVGDELVLSYTLPAWSEVVRLVSNAHPPRGRSEADPDRRMFGVAVLSVTIDAKILTLDCDAFARGFYPIEGEIPRRWRWTNGEGVLIIPAIARTRELAITLTGWHRLLAQ